MFDWRSYRVITGKTANDVAEELGVSQATYSRYENGTVRMSPDVAYRLAMIFGGERIWSDWMRSEYPNSYGKVFPNPIDATKLIAELYCDNAHDEIMRSKNELLNGYVNGQMSRVDAVRLSRWIGELLRGALALKFG